MFMRAAGEINNAEMLAACDQEYATERRCRKTDNACVMFDLIFAETLQTLSPEACSHLPSLQPLPADPSLPSQRP